ncbi:hypothetical protein [Ensifer sp. LCM 4579]|uniref:hypothetical protein n=1 Tax=Ensifer sp. LCM 4579 TaxID=1848292 RepID=UPI0008D997E5|nr:hypothetical protein [Ensifer sp. LCM 4579]OHV85932.1 hypothetical protein LCM4579_00795 [Ensifer sp. LCM 4579]
MTDERDMTIAYLNGKIESLQFLLNVVIALLPESHRDYAITRMAQFARYAEDEAARKDTDPARDSRDAAYDTCEYFEIRVDEEVEIFKDPK